jgi:hypothetical protein
MFEWFKNLFSLEERKASTIMSVFIMFSCVGVYMIKVIGDVPINLTSIILSLAMIIGGVNSISGISDIIKMGKEKSKNTNLQETDSSVINTNSDSNSDSDINGNV